MVESICFSEANDTSLSYDAITTDKIGKDRFLITFLLVCSLIPQYVSFFTNYYD